MRLTIFQAAGLCVSFLPPGWEARLYGRQDACRYKRNRFCDGPVESPTLPFLFEDTRAAALGRWNRTTSPIANGWLGNAAECARPRAPPCPTGKPLENFNQFVRKPRVYPKPSVVCSLLRPGTDALRPPTLPFLFADTRAAALGRWNRDHQPHRERLAP